MLAQIRALLILALVLFSGGALAAQSLDRIVAIVNDKAITELDVKRALGAIETEYKSIYSDPQQLVWELGQVKENIIKQMVEEKLILSQAEQYGIEIDEDAIEARIEKIRKSFFNEEQFQAALLAQGLTLGNLRSRFRDQAIMQKAVDYFVRSKIEVDPIEMKQFYQAHQEEFVYPERAKIATILIRVDELGQLKALQTAESIFARLKKGESFKDLIQVYSQGNLGEGGSLGFVKKGELIEEIDKIVFSLEPGEFSNVIKTEQGYRIFKVEEKEASRPLSFTEAYDLVREILYGEKFSRGFREWMEGLKQDAYISIKEDPGEAENKE